jgi:hypothetical protein
MDQLIDALLALSPDICYIAVRQGAELTMREKAGLPARRAPSRIGTRSCWSTPPYSP